MPAEGVARSLGRSVGPATGAGPNLQGTWHRRTHQRPRRGSGPGAVRCVAFLELLALSGLVFVQPTFDVLSKNATIFVTHDTTPGQALLFVLAVALLPPLAAWALEVRRRARPPGRPTGGPPRPARRCSWGSSRSRSSPGSRTCRAPPPSLLAVPAAIAGGIAIARYAAVRQWLRYLAFAVPVFVILFLGFSPVTDAVFSEGPTSAADVRIKNDAHAWSWS